MHIHARNHIRPLVVAGVGEAEWSNDNGGSEGGLGSHFGIDNGFRLKENYVKFPFERKMDIILWFNSSCSSGFVRLNCKVWKFPHFLECYHGNGEGEAFGVTQRQPFELWNEHFVVSRPGKVLNLNCLIIKGNLCDTFAILPLSSGSLKMGSVRKWDGIVFGLGVVRAG